MKLKTNKLDILTNNHWNYTSKVIAYTNKNIDYDLLNTIEFFYKEAFKHGFKHGITNLKILERTFKRIR